MNSIVWAPVYELHHSDSVVVTAMIRSGLFFIMPSVGHPAALKFRLSILRILFRYQCLTPSNRDCLYHFHSSFWLWFQDLNFSPLVQRSEEETVLINNKSVTKAGNNAAQLPGDLFYLSLHLDTNAVLTFRELAGLQTFRWSRSLKVSTTNFAAAVDKLNFQWKVYAVMHEHMPFRSHQSGAFEQLSSGACTRTPDKLVEQIKLLWVRLWAGHIAKLIRKATIIHILRTDHWTRIIIFYRGTCSFQSSDYLSDSDSLVKLDAFVRRLGVAYRRVSSIIIRHTSEMSSFLVRLFLAQMGCPTAVASMEAVDNLV